MNRKSLLAARNAHRPSAAISLSPAALWAFGSAALAGTMSHDPAVARGEHIARLVCSACHLVAVDQEYPPMLNHPAPDFSDIANRPGTTADSVQKFVTHTHWNLQAIPLSMPDMMLSKDETRAVALYIMSLRKP
jgi:mono/diheme cytochrome c family protein